jgi:lysophospholipase-3
MRLEYDNVTRQTYNSPGVETRVPGFGNSSTVEWLDPSEASPGAYFHNIAEMMVNKLGYRRGIDLHGAPYDFRKAPSMYTTCAVYDLV